MREADIGLGILERLEGLFELVALPRDPPQEGIDESGLAGKSQALGQFNRLVHRGMVRNAIEEEHLIKANPQQITKNERLGTIVGAPGDQPIEERLLADGAERQLVQECTIRQRKAGLLACPSQFVIEPGSSFRPAAPQTNGNFSWFFHAHVPIMSSARLPSSFLAI